MDFLLSLILKAGNGAVPKGAFLKSEKGAG